MARLILLIPLFIFYSSNGFAQTYSESISDKKIHEFIQENKKSLGKGKLTNTIISWDSCALFRDLKKCVFSEFVQIENDSLITIDILKELQGQFNHLNTENLTFGNLKPNTQKKKYQISVPLFADEERTAIIIKSISCGNECGGGGILIFKKDGNQKWKEVEYRSTWIN